MLPIGARGYLFIMIVTRYSCAVLLIISSIVMVFIELFRIDDVPDGLIFYIAQAFLLAGSIFGLDYYIKRLTSMHKEM